MTERRLHPESERKLAELRAVYRGYAQCLTPDDREHLQYLLEMLEEAFEADSVDEKRRLIAELEALAKDDLPPEPA